MNEWERVEKEKKLRERWEGVSNFVKMLFKELDEKEKQIEKMKCCWNCYHFCMNEKGQLGCGISTREIDPTYRCRCDDWKLKE